MPQAATSALYSRIARKYHANDTRDLKGLRLRAKKKVAPKPEPEKPKSNGVGANTKGFPPPPKAWTHGASLAQMGLRVEGGDDPLWRRQFLMRGSEILVWTGPCASTKEARDKRRRLVADYLASMTLYSLPPAFYCPTRSEHRQPGRSVRAG